MLPHFVAVGGPIGTEFMIQDKRLRPIRRTDLCRDSHRGHLFLRSTRMASSPRRFGLCTRRVRLDTVAI